MPEVKETLKQVIIHAAAHAWQHGSQPAARLIIDKLLEVNPDDTVEVFHEVDALRVSA